MSAERECRGKKVVVVLSVGRQFGWFYGVFHGMWLKRPDRTFSYFNTFYVQNKCELMHFY